MNLAEIRTLTRQFLNEPSEAFWLDSELNGYINLGVKKVHMHIKNISRHHFTTRANFQTVANQEYYQLPADLKDLKLISKLTSDGTELPLEIAHWPNPFAWTEDPLPTSTSTSGEDVPAGFWIVGGSLRGVPIPNTAITIRLYYEARLVDLIDDTDIPTYDPDYHDLAAVWAAMLARVKNSEPSADLAAIMKERKEDLWTDVYHRVPANATEVTSYLQGLP